MNKYFVASLCLTNLVDLSKPLNPGALAFGLMEVASGCFVCGSDL